MSLSCLLVEDESSQDKNYLGWGSTDGTFQEQQYFTCQRNHGLFVSVEKLFPLGQPAGRGRESPRLVSSLDPHYRYKIGDRVVVFTKKGDAVHGTVKWVGMYSLTVDKKPHSFKAVAVETVSLKCIVLCQLSPPPLSLSLSGCKGEEK